MKHLLPALLLGLAARPALAGPPPLVPPALDVAGLHLSLDEEARQLVQAKVNSLCRHPASLAARVALAEAAFPIIDQVLAQEGIPADFRYLVLQESALQGDAESIHGAVGYWQFKAATARELGLTVNEQVDERRHLTASTRAAARYLARSQASLHNWANALLSYNLGPSGVRPFVRPEDDGATDMAFTARTNSYLLDFIAQKLVFEPACAAGNVPFTPWREVPAAPGLDLATQALALGADPAAVARLNTWLLASTVPQNGRAYSLLVPLATAPVAAQLPPIPADAAPDAELAAINALPTEVPGLPELPLPAARPVLEAPAVRRPRPVVRPVVVQAVSVAPGPAAPAAPYVVAPGETLYALARRQGVRPADLAAWNNLSLTAGLRAGQVLRLGPLPTATAPTGSSGYHTVMAGDTFFSISRRYRCSVDDLLAHNERPVLALRVGEVLRVPRY